MEDHHIGYLALIALFLTPFFIYPFWEKAVKDCENKGGVYVQSVCFNPEALIDLKETK